MKLSQRLFLGVSIGFLLLLAGMQWIYLANARTYLQQQLSSNAQNVATSLGLTLPRPLSAGDIVGAEILVNTIFDRGYYQNVRVISLKGEILIDKTLAPTPPEVPTWFAALFRLETPAAESLISDGWKQIGRVLVVSHPNFAYLQLWNTTKQTCLWLLILYVLALGLLHIFLTAILRPLREIESAADSIAARDFVTIDPVPSAPELRRAVTAINSLSNKIRQTIELEIAQAERFRREAYVDVLSGLDNRRGLEEQLRSLLDPGTDHHTGALYMIELHDFKQFNETQGFERGDELIRLVGKSLSDFLSGAANVIRARVGGATFAINISAVSRDAAATFGDQLRTSLLLTLEEQRLADAIALKIGGAYYDVVAPQTKLLATADMAMLQSAEHDADHVVLLDCHGDAIDEQGSLYWKNLLTEALAQNRVALLAQPVLSLPARTIMKHEVLGRIKTDTGTLIAAATFMPMVARHNLAPRFDMKLIETVLAALPEYPALRGPVALNLSGRSLRDPGFLAWFAAAMSAAGPIAKRLVFEFAESSIIHDIGSVAQFVARARSYGASFAVDNFGLHRQAFEYLQTLKPDYLKLDRTFVVDLATNREHQFFVSTIVKIAQPLEIKVIALGVESADALKVLEQLGVDGYQGYIGGEAAELENVAR